MGGTESLGSNLQAPEWKRKFGEIITSFRKGRPKSQQRKVCFNRICLLIRRRREGRRGKKFPV